MSKDQDKFIEDEYSLEDILEEYAARPVSEESLPRTMPGRKGPEENVIPFPGAGELPEEEEPSPLEEGIEMLRRKADDFADQMFANEGEEVSEQTMRIERLVPGVDEEEEEPPRRRRERKPRKAPGPLPDTAPAELYRAYGKNLGLLRLRWLLVCLLCLPQLWLLLAGPAGLPLPGPLGGSYQLQVYVSAGLFAAAAVLSIDTWGLGLVRLCLGRPGMETLLGFAVVSTAVDALTVATLAPRDGELPYCGVVTLALAFGLRGIYLKRRALRLSCKVAASAQEPYQVTLDQARWNGRATYSKHAGTISGFGSQIQADDGAQRMFRVAAPVILAACLALSLLASVGKDRPEYLPWCLSATFTAAAAFGSLLVYGKPFFTLAKRLAGSGAALAGWDGIQEKGRGILLTDTDLFPPGTVTVNGIKVFGDFPIEKVVAVTATLIRESGSGLDKIFRDLLRAQGGMYRNCKDYACYEGGGMSAVARDQQILVGSAAFMTLMEIRLPQGLNVKNAVFCAIDGELAGIFALNYSLHGAISPALYALIQNKISPVLATRDFNIIPAMLRQRFKLPVEKMEYPAVERRMELSDPGQDHDPILTAVLCREGLAPFSEAVVGAQRLRRATRLSCALTCLGSVVGVLLAFYLTVSLAFTSLSAVNMLIFQLMWLVPTYLISGWVNKY